MTLLFTNYDRHSMCSHDGVLGKKAKDGSRTCIRCGVVVRPKPESFTKPAGESSSRLARTNIPR